MNQQEAQSVVATMQAIWPKSKLGDDSVFAYIRLLSGDQARFAVVDAFAALDAMALDAKFMPALRELADAIAVAKRDRLGSEDHALPEPEGPFMTFREFLDQNPDMQARVDAIQDTPVMQALRKEMSTPTKRVKRKL